MEYNALPSTAVHHITQLQILLSKPSDENHLQSQQFQQAELNPQNIAIQSITNLQELSGIMTKIEADAKDLSDWKFTVYVIADYGSKTILALSLVALGYFIISEDGDPTSDDKDADRQFFMAIAALASTIIGGAGTYIFSGKKQEAINKKSNLQTLHAAASIFFKLNPSNQELLNSHKEPWYKRLCCTNCISSCWSRLSGNSATDKKNENDKNPENDLESGED